MCAYVYGGMFVYVVYVISSEKLSGNRSSLLSIKEEMSGFMKYDSWQRAWDGCNYRPESGSACVTEKKTVRGYLEGSADKGQTLKVIQI